MHYIVAEFSATSSIWSSIGGREGRRVGVGVGGVNSYSWATGV